MSSDLVTVDELLRRGDLELVQDGNHGGNYPKVDEFTTAGVPLITGACLIDGVVDYTKAVFLTHDRAEKLRVGLAKPGDVLLTHKGTMGKTAIVPESCYGLTILNPQLTLYRVSKTGGLLSRYLKFYFDSELFQKFLVQISATSTINTLPIREQKKLEIPVPPKDVQAGIVAVLGALDDRIAVLRETSATLEAIAQALFKSWFVDFDPVRAKMEGRTPEGMDEATAALFPDSFEESELGLVPTGWRVEPLEKWLAVLETGRRPKGGVSGIESGVPSIGAESITRIGEFDYGKTKFVSHEFFQKMKSGALESHDVLLYKDGGKPGVFLPRVSMFGDGFPFEVCGINEHVFRIRLKEPFGQNFLYFWLWSDAVMHELKHRGGKAAIPGINQADVKEQRLTVPSDLILKQYEAVTSPLISAIFKNAKQIRTLANLRDILLPRLISGQLRLSEN